MTQQVAVSRWTVLWPVVALIGALAFAVGGAIVTGTAIGTVTGGVEMASANSSNFLARVADLFPLGFAFSAGMVSAVNPCGFAMLPAYLGLFLGDLLAAFEALEQESGLDVLMVDRQQPVA